LDTGSALVSFGRGAALSGCDGEGISENKLAWQRDCLNPPAAVREATAAYLEAEDAIAAWITDCCARDPNAWSSSTALFGSWSAWATKTGESIGSQKVFSQKLENQAGIMKHSTNAGKGFYGLRIKLIYPD